IIVLNLSASNAQRWTREEYIDMYSDWAIDEMKRSGIPASITLAQGMLESDNGNSTLAIRGNNHFGIKCHGWKGKKIIHDDDRKNECFRKYRSAKESYTDHTDFLMNSPRYSFLFELDQTDYKGWAKGLKKAGYATAPKYANLLIQIIQENELHQYDKRRRRTKPKDPDEGLADVGDPALGDVDDFEVEVGRRILVRNRINYIIVKEGDTYQSLTRELDLMPFELAKYNEVQRDSKLSKGQVLYLQPKRGKASVEFRFHTVEEGETMYMISQMYGIKLKKLLKKNLIKPGEEPYPGDIIHLRKKKEAVELDEASFPEEE
ncbi:glycoside hydrolase family 73 protein, partial [Bacteroidota bacterium]